MTRTSKSKLGRRIRFGRPAFAVCSGAVRLAPVFYKGRIVVGSTAPSPSALADQLLQAHPIRVEPGFEGIAGISGGAWPDDANDDDALAYLCFSEGTVDLPLHVHEFSDRFIAAADGFGLFHYMHEGASCNELRSLVVQAGDVIVFKRGLVHTFTAPVADFVLLSYHAPFFAFDDARQFRVTRRLLGNAVVRTQGTVVSIDEAASSTKEAL